MTSPPTTTYTSRFTAHAPWILAAAAVAARVAVALASHFTSEGCLRPRRDAADLARGHGLVYDPAERGLGTTAPLYALLLAGRAWLGLPATAVGKGGRGQPEPGQAREE